MVPRTIGFSEWVQPTSRQQVVPGNPDSLGSKPKTHAADREAFAQLRSLMLSSPAGQPQEAAGLPGLFFLGAPRAHFRTRLPAEPRLGFWAPIPLPERQWHCLAASRLGQRLAANQLLLVAVERVSASLHGDAAGLLYAPGFALAAHLRVTSQRYSLGLLELRPLPAMPTRRWFRQQANLAQRERYQRLYYFHLAEVEAESPSNRTLTIERSGPTQIGTDRSATAIGGIGSPTDWIAIHLASTVHVLSVRSGGNIEAALLSRLAQKQDITWDVRLLDAPLLTNPQVAANLRLAGAVRWSIESPEEIPLVNQESLLPRTASVLSPRSFEIEQPKMANFLYHWTRRPPLSRRIESDQHIQQLLERVAKLKSLGWGERLASKGTAGDVLASPLWTLLEIVTSGRLMATGRWTSNSYPVVSLTAQPPERWPELRTFRAHLGRWDFEPYGIGLDRDRICELGGCPVIYGDEQLRKKLAPARRAWFQPANTRGGGKVIDWTVEQEWRVPGDVDLRQFGESEAVVFVPTEACVEVVAPFSRWPVVAIEE